MFTNLIGTVLVVMSVNTRTNYAQFAEVITQPTNVVVYVGQDADGKPIGKGQKVTLNTQTLTGKTKVVPYGITHTFQLGLKNLDTGEVVKVDNEAIKSKVLKVDLPPNWKLMKAAQPPPKKKKKKTAKPLRKKKGEGVEE